jgi:hypothetical protein
MDGKRKYLVGAIMLPVVPIVGLLFLPPTRAPMLITPHLLALFGGVPYLPLVPLLIGVVGYSSGHVRRRTRRLAPLAHFIVIAVFVGWMGRNGGNAGMLMVRIAIVGIVCVAIDYVYLLFVKAGMPDRLRLGQNGG